MSYNYGGGSPYGGFSPIPQGPFQQLGAGVGALGPEVVQGQQVIQQQQERRSKAVLAKYQLLFSIYKNDPTAIARFLPQLENDLRNSGDPAYKNFQLPRQQATQQPNIMGPAGAPPGGAPSGAWGTPGTPYTPPAPQTIAALPPGGGPYGGTWNVPPAIQTGVPAAAVPPGMEHPFVPTAPDVTTRLPVPTSVAAAQTLQPATGPMAQAVPPSPPAAAGTGGAVLPPGTAPAAYQPPTTTDQIMMPPTSAADTPLADWLGPGMIDKLARAGYNKDRISKLTLGEVKDVPGLSDTIDQLRAQATLDQQTGGPPSGTPGAPSAPPAVAGLVPGPAAPPAVSGAGATTEPQVVLPNRRTAPYTGPIRTKGDIARRMGYSEEFASQYDGISLENYRRGAQYNLDAAQKEIMADANSAIRTDAAQQSAARASEAAARTAKEDARKTLVREASASLIPGGRPINWQDFGKRLAAAGLTPEDVMPDATAAADKLVRGHPIWVDGPNGQKVPLTPEAAMSHWTTVAHNKFTEDMANRRIDLEERRFAQQGKTPRVTINGVSYTFPELKLARTMGAVTDQQIKAVIPNYVPPPPTDKISPVDRERLSQQLAVIHNPDFSDQQHNEATAIVNKINAKYGIDPIPAPPAAPVTTTDQSGGGFLDWWSKNVYPGPVQRQAAPPATQQQAPPPAANQYVTPPPGASAAPKGLVPSTLRAGEHRNHVLRLQNGRRIWSDGSNWYVLPTGGQR